MDEHKVMQGRKPNKKTGPVCLGNTNPVLALTWQAARAKLANLACAGAILPA
jgi:hypothetical protein